MASEPIPSNPSFSLVVARFAAVVGILASLAATGVTFLSMIGLSPWWLYGPVAGHFSTGITAHRVPIEVCGVAWFTAVLTAGRFRRPLERERIAFISIGSAVVTGAGMWLTFSSKSIPLLTGVGALGCDGNASLVVLRRICLAVTVFP